uniref:aralkylamine N-acetyltransferase n=1 Tax=Ciona savignyi TaxID=51511 RepID=H2ZCL9_CIOSA
MTEAIDQDLIHGKIGCRRLTAADRQVMLDFLLHHFLPREPICKVMEKLYPGKVAEVLKDRYSQICAWNNASLIAYNKQTGENVGIIFGSLRSVADKKVTTPNNELALVLRLFDALNKDLPSYVGDGQYLRVAWSTVKDTYCRQRIMTKIRKRLELVAKELKCSYITSESSSIYTQKITKNLGYSLKNEIKFVDHVDPVTGTRIMKDVEPPHYCIRLMIKQID